MITRRLIKPIANSFNNDRFVKHFRTSCNDITAVQLALLYYFVIGFIYLPRRGTFALSSRPLHKKNIVQCRNCRNVASYEVVLGDSCCTFSPLRDSQFIFSPLEENWPNTSPLNKTARSLAEVWTGRMAKGETRQDLNKTLTCKPIT